MNDLKREPTWDDQFAEAAAKYLERYFGGWSGLTNTFPCMRNDYPWSSTRPDVADSRIPAKNNTEYHGVESLAAQYHGATMYEEASHHWLLAAWCRQIDKATHGFDDVAHDQAISFCLKNALFNEALKKWSDGAGRQAVPKPDEFGLTDKQVDRITAKGVQVLEDAIQSSLIRNIKKP